MKTIIAGSRWIGEDGPSSQTLKETTTMRQYLDTRLDTITEVISCHDRGPATHGERWARHHGIPITQILSNWDDGASRDQKRNARMAKEADCLIAFWDGSSRGTRDIIARMQALKKPAIILFFDKPSQKPRRTQKSQDGLF